MMVRERRAILAVMILPPAASTRKGAARRLPPTHLSSDPMVGIFLYYFDFISILKYDFHFIGGPLSPYSSLSLTASMQLVDEILSDNRMEKMDKIERLEAILSAATTATSASSLSSAGRSMEPPDRPPSS